MNDFPDPVDTSRQAFLGALVADAVAMPVHWYYDRQALARDYGTIKIGRAHV